MCRISGTVGFTKEQALHILDYQKKGGPDLSKLQTVNDRVCFSHNLLSIIGHQEQPVSSDRYVMTFNGCWYDFKDYYPYATSDTIALLMHFNAKGLEALKDVNGMFSIGLYDKLEEKIHLIVDHFGQKPCYYYHSGDKFAFASNPAALYELQDKWELDRDALQSYWLLGSVMGSDGIFKGIKKVCAGEIVTFDLNTNKVSTSRWYEPMFQVEPDLEGLVYDAIDKVKVADVPIHIFLSGGVDSTLVASRFAGGNAIHLDSPEREHAQFVADKFNINLKVLSSFNINTEECLTDYVLNSGMPTMAGLIPYITAREVAKFGRVAITANGSDEIFMGYNRTHDVIDSNQIDHIFRNVYRFTLQNFTREYLTPNINKGRLLELGTYVQYDLNNTLDSASMCHGLEVRSPFLDHRLVEAALSVPESVHRKKGNKTILKEMLRKLGFNNQFINRPKVGFSLHKQPTDIDKWKRLAWNFAIENNFLKIPDVLSGRDKAYLEMSALGYYFFYTNWKHKIK